MVFGMADEHRAEENFRHQRALGVAGEDERAAAVEVGHVIVKGGDNRGNGAVDHRLAQPQAFRGAHQAGDVGLAVHRRVDVAHWEKGRGLVLEMAHRAGADLRMIHLTDRRFAAAVIFRRDDVKHVDGGYGLIRF